MQVLKFGGTSMGDENTWRQILNIIAHYERPVVVVSATARTTRQLIAAAESATDNLEKARAIGSDIWERHHTIVQNFLVENATDQSPKIQQRCYDWIDQCLQTLYNSLEEIAADQHFSDRRKDAIASIGEQLSAYLFAQCGRAFGLSTTWVDAKQIIKTDSNFGKAIPNMGHIQACIHHLSDQTKKGNIPIMGGFYGEDAEERTTTLGFEGSDYTATLVGSVLKAETVEIWTDVSGIYTCDPRVVKNARPIPELSFQEATELAYFGAKVLHPSTMKPAASAQIPVYVKNIFEPDHPGTKIHGRQAPNGWAKALTYLDDIIILTVTAHDVLEGYHFLATAFEILDKAKQSVNAVTTTEASVSFALTNSDQIDRMESAFQSIGSVEVKKTQGLISLIGCAFDDISTIQKRVLNAIGDVHPTLFSYSKAKQNLNVAVPETELIPAVCRIHGLLFAE